MRRERWPAGLLVGLTLSAGCSREPPFVRDDGGWRYEGLRIDVDSASFRPLGRHYGVDARQAIHADTFRESSDYFTTRRLRVTVVKGADLASFQVLDDDHARDRGHVYHEGRPLAVKDVASFELLEHGFARDRIAGYYQQTLVPGSDGRSFQAAGHHLAKDAMRVWWCDIGIGEGGAPSPRRCQVLAGAAPQGFEVLERRYSRSGDRIYHQDRVVEGADAARFVAGHGFEGDIDAQDASSAYRDGRRVGPAALGAPASAAVGMGQNPGR